MTNFKQWCIENEKYKLLLLYENAQNTKKSNEIGFSTREEVNWKCTKCGMEWKMSTNKMNKRKEECLYCSHKKVSKFYNLQTEAPILVKEWNYERNTKKPIQYLPTSKEKVWWKCKNGHEWEGGIYDRIKAVDRNIKLGRPICPYCNHEKVSSTYNLVTEFPDIAKQWNYKMNGSLIPQNVTPKSQQKVWWTCEYDPTHVWQSRISNRTILHRGCSICARRVKTSLPERVLYYYLKLCFNDCEIQKRMLDKYILDIFIPSHKIIIEYDGWYYHSDEKSKKREKKKDRKLNEFDIIRIKEVKEEINEIIYDNNIIKYHPQERYTNLDELIKEILKIIEKKTKTKLKYNIDYERDYKKIQEMYYHVRKSYSLAVKKPELAKEWSIKNEMSPDNITLGSSYNAKWICPKCNREYIATVNNRVKHNSNCPFCSNKKVCKENSLAYRFPEISKEWNYERNGDLLPENVIAGSDKKVWWKCKKGHEWQTHVYSRTGKKYSNCPYCRNIKLSKDNSPAVVNEELSKE